MAVVASDAAGCLLRIKSMYDALTNSEQTIARFVLDRSSEVVNLSITELAEESNNSEATIFRFCKKLGFSGYQAFKIALAGDLYSPLETVFREVNPGDGVITIAQKVFGSITESLQNTLKILSAAEVEQAINLILQAEKIQVYALGGSVVIAEDIVHQFMHFAIPAVAYSDAHLQIAAAALLKPNDLVIAISHTGSNKDLLASVGLAKQSGAVVIAITSHMKSPLTEQADVVLYTSAQETAYRSEAMASRISHLAITDVLYIGIFLKRQKQIFINIQKIREAIALKRV